MASLPLKLAIFFFIPKLPAIDQILPYYIGTRCYGSKRIQEGEGEPDAYVVWQNLVNGWQLWYKEKYGKLKW